MGAHSQPREGFNRTMAIAVAAGLAVTGTVQFTAPADSVFGAAAHAAGRAGTTGPAYMGVEIFGTYPSKQNPMTLTVQQAQKQNALGNNVVGDVHAVIQYNTVMRGNAALRTIDEAENVVEDGPSALSLAENRGILDSKGINLSMNFMEKPGLWGAELVVNDLALEGGRGSTYVDKDTWYRIVDYVPSYDGGTVAPGDTLEIPLINSGSEDAPDLTLFRLANSFANNPYWDVKIGYDSNSRDDAYSGNLYVTLKKDAPLGSQILIPVDYTFYNGVPETIYASVSSGAVTKGANAGDGANAGNLAIKQVRDNKDGTFTLIRNDDTEVPGKINVGDGVKTITSGNDGTITLTYINGTQSKPIKLSQVGVTQSNPGKPDNKITLTVPGGQTVTFDAYDNYVNEVRDNKDGSFTLVRRDGSEVKGKITTGGNVKSVEPGPAGSIVLVYNDGKKSDPVKLDQTTITETNKGKPDHKVTITSPNGQTVTLDAFDNYVTDVKKNAQGNYDIYRSDVGDGKTVWKTIDIKDLRDKVATLEKNDAPSRDEFKKVQDDIVGIKTDVLQNATDINKNTGDIVDLKREVSSLENRMGKVEDRLTKVEKASIKEIRDNKDGSYTIIRQDGTAVSGKIDGSGNVTGITPNKDGSVTLTFADGTKSDPVKLAQTTITETNKGKPDHKVTITSPNGQTVTLDAFDNYVTDVKKNAQGNYDIYRSDVGGGKTVWKTIDLADLRTAVKTLDDRAKKLETQGDSNTAQITNIKKEIARIDGEIKRVDGELSTLSERATASEDRLNTIESDITDIRSDILSVDLRVTSLEARVSEIEGRLNTGLGKCVGTVGSSLAALVPAVALASQFAGGSNIPAVDGAIANFQRQMGMFNPQMAQAVDRNRGAIAAGLAGLGLLALVFVPGTCGDASLGQAVAEPLSSARDARRAEREAARENGEGGSSIKVGADVAAGNGAGSSEQ